jgi:hypothetical protein
VIDLLVLGEGNVDLVISGGDVEPAFRPGGAARGAGAS